MKTYVVIIEHKTNIIRKMIPYIIWLLKNRLSTISKLKLLTIPTIIPMGKNPIIKPAIIINKLPY